MQIGEVADRTGLSLRTIRYYEEIGLVCPSSRTQGGFRLYTEPDIARLNLVKRMKPLGFTLDETRELLGVLDALESERGDVAGREEFLRRLATYKSAAEQRCAELRGELETAEAFSLDLRHELNRQKRLVDVPR
jgi:DNA-binding transcriptional MerR regulator